MAAVFNVIMLGVSGLFTIPLIQGFFPAQVPATTVIALTTGQVDPDSFGGSNLLGGPMPNVALFDVLGDRVGFMNGQNHGSLKAGRTSQIVVTPIDSTNNVSPEYLSVSARGSDAICIAYLAVTGPTSEYWSWHGGFGKLCGQPWYNSQAPLLGTPTRPPCIWISNDGRFPMGFGLHMIDFGNSFQESATIRSYEYGNNTDAICNSKPRQHFYPSLTELNCLPVFRPPPDLDENMIETNMTQVITDGYVACSPPPGQTPTAQEYDSLRQVISMGKAGMKPTYGIEKRDATRYSSEDIQPPLRSRSDCDYQHVVLSSIDSHSARELCESPTSAGPDFFSKVEGLLCNMCDRSLWPVCSPDIISECFDLEGLKIITGKNLKARGVDGVETTSQNHSYNDSVSWE